MGENEKIDMANILSMPVTTSFGDYLGCPILDRRPRKTDFKKVIDKMHSKVAGWKSKSIAMAGRNTLIYSVNCRIPAHVMQNTMLPKSVHKAIDKVNQNFLRGSTEEHRENGGA